MSVRSVLRSATRSDHERVDAAFSEYDLASRDGYRRFLLRQASAHLPVEQALDRAGMVSVLGDWPERRRAARIRADLTDLGCESVSEQRFGGFGTPASALGGVYVLEGSRLGGAMLAKQVGAGFPKRFLTHGSSGAWRALLAVLEAKLVSAPAVDEAVEGARAVFACFAAAGHAGEG